MGYKKLFEIKNNEELLAFSNDNLEIDEEASVTISVDFFMEIKENILYGKYKVEELDRIAPSINFFIEEEADKLEKKNTSVFCSPLHPR